MNDTIWSGFNLSAVSILWGFILKPMVLANVAIVANANTSPWWLVLLAATNIKIPNFKIYFDKSWVSCLKFLCTFELDLYFPAAVG